MDEQEDETSFSRARFMEMMSWWMGAWLLLMHGIVYHGVVSVVGGPTAYRWGLLFTFLFMLPFYKTASLFRRYLHILRVEEHSKTFRREVAAMQNDSDSRRQHELQGLIEWIQILRLRKIAAQEEAELRDDLVQLYEGLQDESPTKNG